MLALATALILTILPQNLYSMSEQEMLLLKEPIKNITGLKMLELLNKEDAASRERRKASPAPTLIFPENPVLKPRRLEASLLTGAAYYHPQDVAEIARREALDVLRELQTTPAPTPAPQLPAPAHTCNKHRLLGLFNWAVKTLWPDTQDQ